MKFAGAERNTTFKKIIATFKGESDRAVGLIVTSAIDEGLKQLISHFLVDPGKDDIFNKSSFYTRIELVYRLGLISNVLRRQLHLIRGIRNKLAHNILDVNFNNKEMVKDISDLTVAFDMSKFMNLLKKESSHLENNTRGKFLWIVTRILYHVTSLLDITPLETRKFTRFEHYFLKPSI